MARFIGRSREMAKLRSLIGRNVAKMVLLKGRRRIGKSRLLLEFGKIVGKVHLLTGLAPDKGITSKHQREEFARQLDVELGLKGLKADDWSDLFWNLAQQTQKGPVLVVLDEISWMAMDDATFLPKLQLAWERYFRQ